MLKNKKGITLIALIITIIILIILAGITISTLAQNGLFGRTQDAKEKTNIAREKEQIKMSVMAVLAKDYTKIAIGDLEEELGKYEDISSVNGVNTIPNNVEIVANKKVKLRDLFISTSYAADATDYEYAKVTYNSGRIYYVKLKGNDKGKIYKTPDSVNPSKEDDKDPDENPGVLEGEGTDENPYTINSIEDLVAFSSNVNSGSNNYVGQIVTLGRNLYFDGSHNSYANENSKYAVDVDNYTCTPNENSTSTIKELLIDKEKGIGFFSIGASKNTFKGTFDGKGHFLDGLQININEANVPNAGLFGKIDTEVTIKNIGINSGKIDKGYKVGAIIAYITNSVEEVTIENCYNKAQVGGYSDCIAVGGIIGYSESTKIKIINCYNEGKIGYGSAHVGGIMGNKEYSGNNAGKQEVTISGCHNSGELVNQNAENIGGIVGDTYGTTRIYNCYNTGNISTQGTIGGIICRQTGGDLEIEKCYNTGNIQATSLVSGIATYISGENVKIKNSYNEGNITGNDIGPCAGILVYENSYSAGDVTIEDCYNKGNLEKVYIAGGIYAEGGAPKTVTINRCYNTGSISSYNGAPLGGIAPKFSYNTDNVQIVNCYNTGDVSTEKVAGQIGGIAGTSTDKTLISNCYNTGNISNSSPIGGINGSGGCTITNCYNKGTITEVGGSPNGGISGTATEVSNCFNFGEIKSTNSSMTGVVSFGGTIGDNCYYLKRNSNADFKNTNVIGIEENSLEEGKENFVNNVLNKNVLANNANSQNIKWNEWKIQGGNIVFK